MTGEQKARLFQVYYLCHFGRAVAMDLCERAARFNQIVALLTLGCVAASLLAGSISWFGADAWKPVWALLNVVAVVMAIWVLIMSYSEKEFEYHQLASQFQSLALAVENFSGYAVHGETTSSQDIDKRTARFHLDYSEIMGRTRREYKRYGDRHVDRIDAPLRQRMTAAGFAVGQGE